MSILILHKPKKVPEYSKWLASLNEEIIMFAPQGIKASGYAVINYFDDYFSDDLVDEIYNLYKIKPFREIIALSEEDIIRAAQVRTKLNISGQNEESALNYRNKIKMKNVISQAGIKCPIYSELQSLQDLHDFAMINGLPIVIKPIDGFGSMNTFIIRSLEDLHEAEITIRENIDKFMIEKFVEGEMYSVNGLAVNQQIVFCSVNKYSKGCAEFQTQNDQLITTVPHETDIYIKTREFTEQVISTLPSPNNLVFHCELFVSSNNEILFCEIASRTPGGWICEGIEYSHGVDLKEVFVKKACGVDVPITDKKQNELSAIQFIPVSEGKLKNQIEILPFDWVKKYIPVTMPGTICEKANSCIDVSGVVILTADTPQELTRRAEITKDYLLSALEWESVINAKT